MNCCKQVEVTFWLKRRAFDWSVKMQKSDSSRMYSLFFPLFYFPVGFFFVVACWCYWHNCTLPGKSLWILWMTWCVEKHGEQTELPLCTDGAHTFWRRLKSFVPFILHPKLIWHNLPQSWALKSQRFWAGGKPKWALLSAETQYLCLPVQRFINFAFCEEWSRNSPPQFLL